MREEDKQNKPLTIQEIREGCKHLEDGARVCVMNTEMQQGIDFIDDHPNSITFFGSSRLREENEYYQQARELAHALVKEGFTIVTGGGPGIMEAGNRGAKEAGGVSIGLGIELPTEQRINDYATDTMKFHYFFNRKVALAFSAKAFVFFPGGFGTMDETFEILTLVQTNKIQRIPVVFFGRKFWDPLLKVLEESFLKVHKTIDEEDLSLFEVVDTVEEARQTILTVLAKQQAEMPAETV